MNIIKLLKDEYPLDRLVIYMLFHGVNISDTAKALNISRDTVYSAIERSKALLLTLGLLDISE